MKNDLRQTSHARRWCPITPIHLDEVKFAFFGFCPSSFQSCSERQWRLPSGKLLIALVANFSMMDYGLQDDLKGWNELSVISLYKTIPSRVASIMIVETTLERSERVNEMIKMTVYRIISYGKLFKLLLQAVPFRYYSAEKAILHAVKSTLSVFLVGLYFSLRTQHRANSLTPSRPK